MAGIATTISAQFKAIDKMTAPVMKMQRAVGSFGTKASASLNRVSMKMRTLTTTVNKGVSRLGAIGGLGIAMALMTIGGAITQVDKNMQSLSAITGATGSQLSEFAEQVDAVSKSQHAFKGNVAKAFEVVGSAQPVLLKNAAALAKVTDASITLSKAGLMSIADSAKAVTGTMNQFDMGAESAGRVINVMAAGAKEGSANIMELSESMDKVGGVAKSSNMSLEQTAAAVELMSKFNLKGSEAGISLKATLLRLKSASLGFASGQFNLNDALGDYNEKVSKITDPIKKAAYEEKVFGKVHILTGQILTQNIDKLNTLTDAMTGTSEATTQATINSSSLSAIFGEITNVFKNAISTTDNQSESMMKLKKALLFVRDNMGSILKVVGFTVGALVALNVITKAVTITNTLFSIGLGISAAMSGSASIAMAGNTTAIIAMNVATKAIAIVTKTWTAVQWAVNAAIAANPIGAVIVGIIALIAVIVALVMNWNAVKTATIAFYEKLKNSPFASLIIGVIMTVEAVKLLIESFKKIGEAFKAGGFISGIKMIGVSILKFAIIPLRTFLSALSKIPKVGKPFENALVGIDGMIGKMENSIIPQKETDRTEIISPARVEEKRQQNLSRQFGTLNLNVSNTSDRGVDSWMFGDNVKLQTTGN